MLGEKSDRELPASKWRGALSSFTVKECDGNSGIERMAQTFDGESKGAEGCLGYCSSAVRTLRIYLRRDELSSDQNDSRTGAAGG